MGPPLANEKSGALREGIGNIAFDLGRGQSRHALLRLSRSDDASGEVMALK